MSEKEQGILKLSSPATKEFWEIPVLYEDESLLVVDKPAHLLVSPDRYDPNRPNLMQLLHRDVKRGAPWVLERKLTYLANAHRLDFETTGVLLLAKSKPALINLANQFNDHRPHKEYVALVSGTPPADPLQIETKLAPHPTRLGLMRADPKHGKKSVTRVATTEQFTRYGLVNCQALTDRTHQIRVHLKHVGLPIVGDKKYGGRDLLLSQLKPNYRLRPNATERPLLSRVALHASRLDLEHPVGGQPVTISAPLPKDITVALKYLRQFALAA